MLPGAELDRFVARSDLCHLAGIVVTEIVVTKGHHAMLSTATMPVGGAERNKFVRNTVLLE